MPVRWHHRAQGPQQSSKEMGSELGRPLRLLWAANGGIVRLSQAMGCPRRTCDGLARPCQHR